MHPSGHNSQAAQGKAVGSKVGDSAGRNPSPCMGADLPTCHARAQLPEARRDSAIEPWVKRSGGMLLFDSREALVRRVPGVSGRGPA